MSTPELWQIPFSPWSLRARLALRLSKRAYRRRTYLSFVHTPWLRWRLRRFVGIVTVPVLFTEEGALDDSLRIARWSLQGGPWWPDDGAIEAWNRWSEQMLCMGRVRTTRRVLADPVALTASLPRSLAGMGPLSSLLGQLAAGAILRRYDLAGTDEEMLRDMDRLLDQLSGALAGQDYLLGAPSYADITVAVGLSFVSPPAVLPIAHAARPHWTEPTLAARHEALLAWRDRVLALAPEAG